MRAKLIDIILLFVILVSLGFIGYRVMVKGSGESVEKSTNLLGLKTLDPALPVKTVKVPMRQSLFGYRPQAAMAEQPLLDAAAWTKLLSSENLSAIDASAACQKAGASVDGYYSVLAHELELRLIENGGGLLARFGGKKCHRKGQSIHLYSFGDAPDEFYVDDMGEYSVTDIVEFNSDAVSERFWTALGTTGNAAKGPYPETTLLRVVKKSDAKKQDGVFPKIHFRYTQLNEDELSRLPPSPVVIDLRSASDRASAPLAKALVVQFPVAHGPLGSEKFRWNVRIRDLDQSSIQMADVLSAIQTSNILSRVVIVVGNGPDDARPFWLLRQLSNLNFEKVYWYNGKVESLSPYIK